MSKTSEKNGHKFFRSPLKWPGGKFRDMSRIRPLFPSHMGRYIDPFVGSGTVAANVAIDGLSSHLVLGDIDRDLIQFLRMHEKAFDRFQSLLSGIEAARQDAGASQITAENFSQSFLTTSLRCIRHIDNRLRRNDVVRKIVNAERDRRISTMKKMLDAGGCPKPDYPKTAIFALIYYLVRDAYNASDRNTADPIVRIATWYVLRELAHGGMMRYSNDLRFNTAYGGMTYNSKSLLRKLPDISRMASLFHNKKSEIRSEIHQIDFIDLLNHAAPGMNDFIFLDPPYDSAFHPKSVVMDTVDAEGIRTGVVAEQKDKNTNQPQFFPYAAEGRKTSSHEDLFEWLRKNGDRTRWMLVERKTPWITDQIESLKSSCRNVDIQSYERTYAANIKGRNDRNTTHLIVTNYHHEGDK